VGILRRGWLGVCFVTAEGIACPTFSTGEEGTLEGAVLASDFPESEAGAEVEVEHLVEIDPANEAEAEIDAGDEMLNGNEWVCSVLVVTGVTVPLVLVLVEGGVRRPVAVVGVEVDAGAGAGVEGFEAVKNERGFGAAFFSKQCPPCYKKKLSSVPRF
jgi:hypothetical protein